MSAGTQDHFNYRLLGTGPDVLRALSFYEMKQGKLEIGQIVRLSRREYQEVLKASIIVKKVAHQKYRFFELIHNKSKTKKHSAFLGKGAHKRVKKVAGFDHKNYVVAKQMLKKDTTTGKIIPMSKGTKVAGKIFLGCTHIEAGEYFTWTSFSTGRKCEALLMSFCGTTLLDALIEIRKDQTLFMNIVLQIVVGVVAIHKKRKAHLDLNLKNILLFGKNLSKCIVKITDMDYLIDSQPVTIDRSVGTLHYLAPEAKPGSIVYNLQAMDVFSLGVIFCKMYTDCYTLSLDSYLDDSVVSIIKMMMHHDPHCRPTVMQVFDFFKNRTVPEIKPNHVFTQSIEPITLSRATGLPESTVYKLVGLNLNQFRGAVSQNNSF